MDDKGQMLVLETILFAVTIILALIFLYQLSPSSTEANKYSSTIKILGDDTLRMIYNDFNEEKNISTLADFLINNRYGSMRTELDSMLPSTVLYNIYVGNGTKTVFWCASIVGVTSPLPTIEPVTICHHTVAIDPKLLDGTILGYGPSDLVDNGGPFANYMGSTYDVIIEMW